MTSEDTSKRRGSEPQLADRLDVVAGVHQEVHTGAAEDSSFGKIGCRGQLSYIIGSDGSMLKMTRMLSDGSVIAIFNEFRSLQHLLL